MNIFTQKILNNTIGIFFALLVASTVTGTIVWLCYPSLFDIFPTLKASGLIATDPSWTSLVLFTWLFKTLFILPNSRLELPKKSKKKKEEPTKQILND